MEPLRLYLLAGLVAHKLVWELLKRRPEAAPPARQTPLKVRLVKAAKIAILLGVVVQTVAGDVLPVGGDPAAMRLAGALLFTLGLAIAVAGRLSLGNNWLDIETAAVKREQVTVSHGVYRFVRHPIYVGDLILLLGLELALGSWLFAGVLVLIPVVLRQAVREEEMLRRTLPGYDVYCRQTKRFIPFVA